MCQVEEKGTLVSSRGEGDSDAKQRREHSCPAKRTETLGAKQRKETHRQGEKGMLRADRRRERLDPIGGGGSNGINIMYTLPMTKALVLHV